MLSISHTTGRITGVFISIDHLVAVLTNLLASACNLSRIERWGVGRGDMEGETDKTS